VTPTNPFTSAFYPKLSIWFWANKRAEGQQEPEFYDNYRDLM